VAPCSVAFDAEMRCDGPSWTLHGVALPYSTNFNDPSAATNPEQLIPVARIDGPILLNCGGQDLLIPSCLFGSAIEERLNAAIFHIRTNCSRTPTPVT